MKKTLFFIGAMLALIACNKENDPFNNADPAPVSQGDDFKVNITINRTDIDAAGTKAYLKDTFQDNDVVFVFFEDVAAPKYLEMKYNAASGEWVSTRKNDLVAGDLTASGKRMTAIYLPYGSGATVAADAGTFVFNNIDGEGYFLKAEQQSYTYSDGVVTGNLSLYAPILSGSDKYVHFDVSGFTPGHKYDMCQANVKPIVLESISASGVVSTTIGSKGDPLFGYEDGTHLTFSGVLDESVVGSLVGYEFRINDWTDFTKYTRNAGDRIISDNKYIGIGSISSDYWAADDITDEFIDLGLSVKWATRNLGATNPWDYGDYYAWGETTPKYTGDAQANPPTWKDGQSGGYQWSNYVHGTSQSNMTKYNTKAKYGAVDNKTTLELTDDAARVVWGGAWRMPTSAELDELRNSCSWEWTTVSTINGCLVTSNVPGFSNRSIFLPAAGYRESNNLYGLGSSGYYWSSSLWASESNQAGRLFFSSGSFYVDHNGRKQGHSVRPVCE
jgi:hypothetical protein